MTTELTRVSPEVFVAKGGILSVGETEMALLKAATQETPRKRCRICLHPTPLARGLLRCRICLHPSAEAPLHEMIIAHCRGTYVRPHRHRGKSESFHLIEGRLTVVLFDDAGKEVRRVPMAPPGQGRNCLYRLQDCFYHTVLFEDDIVVFHEVTDGPFVREETEFAPWAPTEDDLPGQRDFMAKVMP